MMDGMMTDRGENTMDTHMLNTITNFIWGIADDCLRDVYVRENTAM